MIPLTTNLSTDPVEQRLQLMDNYQQMANLANGRVEEWSPVVYGSTLAGAPTSYSAQRGLYFVRGVFVEVWFAVTWTGHTGTGNMRVTLPFIVSQTRADFFIGDVSAQNIAFPASTTHVNLSAVNDTTYCDVVASRSGTTRSFVQMSAAGTLFGHVCYIIKRDLSRR